MNWAGVRCFSGWSGVGVSERSCMMFPFLGRTDVDAAGDLRRFWPNDRDDQHAVPQGCVLDLDAIGEKEAALELSRGDAAMQEFPRRILLLAASDDELVVLGDHLELLLREAGNRDRDQIGLVAAGI